MTTLTLPLKIIKVGARNSPLSKVQVKEVLQEINVYYPDVQFDSFFLPSQGDKDLYTSLRALNKTNFFTKEIDELVLNKQCQIGIHSAKDLPDPLPKGLIIAALTKGVDSGDVIVMREGESFETLPKGAIIATSSERREDAVKQMREDLKFIDIRGLIAQRLSKLDQRLADGIVVAEAALIRLGLTHLNRIRIPGPTTAFQGQLAVIAREDDPFILNLFSCIDSRIVATQTALYLGLNLPIRKDKKFIHYPIIKIVPIPLSNSAIQNFFQQLTQCTHLLFTSQSAVSIFFDYFTQLQNSMNLINNLVVVAVGKATAQKIERRGLNVHICAKKESSEGLIEEFENLDLENAQILWPHSALSRDILKDYFRKKNINYHSCIFYDTVLNFDYPMPDLKNIDEIIFTSPSCVESFLQTFGKIPQEKKITCIGPITELYYNNKLIIR